MVSNILVTQFHDFIPLRRIILGITEYRVTFAAIKHTNKDKQQWQKKYMN